MSLEKIFQFIFIYCLFIATKAYGSYTLQDLPLFSSCPFMHNDRYSVEVDRLHALVKSQLVQKIEGNQACYGPLNNISQNLGSITTLFDFNTNPNLYQDINDEILNKQLLQLQLDLMLEDQESSAYLTIAQKIRTIEDSIYANDVNKIFNRDFFKENRDNRMLSSTFNYMNNVISTMTNMPPQCIQLLGGWQSLMPTLLNSISSLSGISGFAYSAVMGAGLKLVASLTILLQDANVKLALRDVIKQKNNKIIACTYFSVQNTACEYRRALKLSEEEQRIKDLIKQKYKNKDTRIFDEFFTLLEHSRDFEPVFFEIAAMGSAISLNTDLINTYFVARRSNPETILEESDIGHPPNENDSSDEAEKLRQAWLIDVKERGIIFQERNFMGPWPLKDQVKQALTDIKLKISTIRSVEYVLAGKRAFIDLKHELDANPNLLAKISRFIYFFKQALKDKIIPTTKKGVVAEALRIMVQLKNFLEINYHTYERVNLDPKNTAGELELVQSYQEYMDKVNEQGKLLFGVMAEGAVAQISRQTVLTIGRKVQDRVARFFQLIEEEFLNDEVRQDRGSPSRYGGMKYSEYKRDRALQLQVAFNYQNFAGSGKTFRAEDVDVALKSIEKGFSKEIKRMVKESLEAESVYYPKLNGDTAAHLCSLFSIFLGKKKFITSKSKRILSACKAKFNDLELLKIIEPKKMKILWDDPCYYYDYRRLLTTQQSLYRKMLQIGFELPNNQPE